MNKRAIGTEHEKIACDFLKNKGLEILTVNYRKKIGEIDVIAKDRECIVFVEVKYRKNKNFGGAAYAINVQKQRTITRVAQWYICENHLPQDAAFRFDAVLIDGDEITHIENAW